jgi:hypothetical protein
MSHREPVNRKWDVPMGPIGMGAMAVVGGAASILGAFNFTGYQFLVYWQLIGAGQAGAAAAGAAFGTLLACLVWHVALRRGPRFLSTWPSAHRAAMAACTLAVLAIAYWYANDQYQCLLVRAPIVSLIVFGISTQLQLPILLHLRNAWRPGAALAVVLALEAVTMFLNAESMIAGRYAQALAHFQAEHGAFPSTSISVDTDKLYVDYARQEYVLRTYTPAGDPVEIRHSVAGSSCR